MGKPKKGSSNLMESKVGKENLKRKERSDDEFDDSEDVEEDSGDMATFLQRFTTDLKKKTSAKKKKIAGLAANSSKLTQAKLENILEDQAKVRESLSKEYKKQFENVIAQWEVDIAKAKEAEEKISETIQQQLKLMAQVRLVQTQRLKATKNLYTHYVESLDEAENKCRRQQEGLGTELKKEIDELQRKILADTQAQDMANMKKVLRTVMQ